MRFYEPIDSFCGKRAGGKMKRKAKKKKKKKN